MLCSLSNITDQQNVNSSLPLLTITFLLIKLTKHIFTSNFKLRRILSLPSPFSLPFFLPIYPSTLQKCDQSMSS